MPISKWKCQRNLGHKAGDKFHIRISRQGIRVSKIFKDLSKMSKKSKNILYMIINKPIS
jgi:hypothetical protein